MRRRGGAAFAVVLCAVVAWVAASATVASAAIPPPPLISSAGADTCAAIDGVVRCWGNAYGATPARIAGIPAYDGTAETRITSLSAADSGGCLTQGGDVRCWGPPPLAWYTNPEMTQTRAAVVPGFGYARSVSIGYLVGPICALGDDRRVRCMGSDNRTGQLGNGTLSPALAPTVVLDIDDAVAIGTGTYHACALRAGGEVACWGANQWQQIGIPREWDTAAYTRPVPLPFDDAKALSVGLDSACAVRRSGAVVCWGTGGHGEFLGGDTSNGVATVDGVTDPDILASGTSAHCAVEAGRVRCWGDNRYGQLGNGEASDGGVRPTEIPGLRGVRAIATSLLHTCAVTDSAVWCWGWNRFRQLGDPDFTEDYSPNPRLVPGTSEWLPDGVIRTGGPLTELSLGGDLRCHRRADHQGNPLFAGGRQSCATWVAVRGELFGPEAGKMANGWPEPGSAYEELGLDERGYGTEADPYEVESEVRAGDLLITQVDSYVDGENHTTTSITVRNTGDERLSPRVYNAGDCVTSNIMDVPQWRWGYAYRGPEDVAAGGARCRESNVGGRYVSWRPLSEGSNWTVDRLNAVAQALESGEPLPDRAGNGLIQHAGGLSWRLDLGRGESRTVSLQLGFGGPSDPDITLPEDDDADRDGDGIRDAWEKPGVVVDANRDGRAELNLSAMGAGPDKPDLFVQIVGTLEQCLDVEDGACRRDQQEFRAGPSAAAIRIVQRRFLERGIRLHVDGGPHFVMNPETGERWGIRSRIGRPLFSEALGARNFNIDVRPLDVAAPVLFPELDRRELFRNVAVILDLKKGIAGWGELGGRWMLYSPFAMQEWDESSSRMRVQRLGTFYEAGVLMHELGHSLGLRHGGDVNVNRKPNYPSVMNYLYGERGIPQAGPEPRTRRVLDYSSGDLDALDENALPENAPLTPAWAASTLRIDWDCPGDDAHGDEPASGDWLDWNCDDERQPGPVRADINGDGKMTRLRDHDDWAALQFAIDPDATVSVEGLKPQPWQPVVSVTGPQQLTVAQGEAVGATFRVSNPHGDERRYALSVGAAGVAVSGLPAAVTVPAGRAVDVPVTLIAQAGGGSFELLATGAGGDITDESGFTVEVEVPTVESSAVTGDGAAAPSRSAGAGDPGSPPIAGKPPARCVAPARAAGVRSARRAGRSVVVRLRRSPVRARRAVRVTLEQGCRVVARGTLRGRVVTLRPVRRGARVRGAYQLRWRGGAVRVAVR